MRSTRCRTTSGGRSRHISTCARSAPATSRRSARPRPSSRTRRPSAAHRLAARPGARRRSTSSGASCPPPRCAPGLRRCAGQRATGVERRGGWPLRRCLPPILVGGYALALRAHIGFARSGAAGGPGQNRSGGAAADRRAGAARPRADRDAAGQPDDRHPRVRRTSSVSTSRARRRRRRPSAGPSGARRGGCCSRRTGCPRCPASQVYQLWVVTRSGQPVSAGLLAPDAEGRALVLAEPHHPRPGRLCRHRRTGRRRPGADRRPRPARRRSDSFAPASPLVPGKQIGPGVVIVGNMSDSACGGRARPHRGRQLLRRELPAVFGLDRRTPSALSRGRRWRSPPAGGAAGPVPAHPVLPEAVPLLLLPRLHEQECARRGDVSRPARAGVGAVSRRRRRSTAARSSFVYFGGGTPSFLSTTQLQRLVSRLTAGFILAGAEEVTFECEPGTLTEAKLAAIREMGVTRLSLGVENFSDRILELNGRAHRSPEIDRVYRFARSIGFPQINIDLIAGMLGETDDNWRACVQRTLEMRTRQRDDLSDGAAVQHDHQPRSAQRHRTVRSAGRELVDEAALGRRGVRRAGARRLPRRQRLHRRQGSGGARRSSTATVSGRAPIWWASAWRRSVTSTASTCRTPTNGKRGRRRSSAAICRWRGPIVRPMTNG